MLRVLYFSAPWCGNCKAFGPVVENFIKETNAQLVKVDVEKDLTLCEKYGIMNLPTLIILNDSVEVARVSGLVTKEVLLDKVKTFL